MQRLETELAKEDEGAGRRRQAFKCFKTSKLTIKNNITLVDEALSNRIDNE